MPVASPATLAAVIVMPDPEASLVARMPSPPAPVTAPLTSIAIAPPPVLLAMMALAVPLIALPPADCVRAMPPAPPVCVRTKALPTASIPVSEFSVTDNATPPLALRDWEPVLRPPSSPLQTNAPLPLPVSAHGV